MTTVLEITQDILSLIDGDAVSSISETTESEQVANLIKQNFDMIVDRYDLTAGKSTFQLNAVADLTRPVLMTPPSDITSIEFIKYDCKTDVPDPPAFKDIIYLTPKDFLDFVHQRDSTATDFSEITLASPSNVSIIIYEAGPPTYYTSFDDTQIVFDSYNSAVESYLETSKTLCYGTKKLTLQVDNTTPINLTPNLIELLRKETAELAFDLWKEGAPSRVVRDATKARTRAARRAHLLNIGQEIDKFTGPNYGRNSPRRYK